MSNVERLARVAETDTTFARRGGDWVGKCLICNGPIAFDARTGAGATLDAHPRPARGGTDEPENLASSTPVQRREGPTLGPETEPADADYDAFVDRLLERRRLQYAAPVPNPDSVTDPILFPDDRPDQTRPGASSMGKGDNGKTAPAT